MATKQEKMALREQGMTYRQIADHFGISYQAVAQALGEYNPNHFKYISETGCVYPNLRKWLNDNKVGKSEFARRCGYANVYCNKKRMDYYLTGRNDPPKNVIDKILMVTGLTYEQAFSK
jgi:predicted transcriptional regulator